MVKEINPKAIFGDMTFIIDANNKITAVRGYNDFYDEIYYFESPIIDGVIIKHKDEYRIKGSVQYINKNRDKDNLFVSENKRTLIKYNDID